MTWETNIEKYFDNLKVVKKFPPSGQKRVLLVDYEKFGRVILKIVEANSERVKREIEILKSFKISNVPDIIEVSNHKFEDGEVLVIFEEYIVGNSLKEQLQTSKFDLANGVRLLRALLTVCVELEETKVVHRDIKPDNIICGSDGQFYLIDFGIARQLDKVSLTMTHTPVGPHTPGYGAPELFQYKKTDIDARADLFSIGVVAFEAMTGHHPFIDGNEADIHEVWYRTRTVIPQEYEIEGDKSLQLMAFIQTLMQKHITRRPPSAKKALEWFEALLPTLEKGSDD